MISIRRNFLLALFKPEKYWWFLI